MAEGLSLEALAAQLEQLKTASQKIVVIPKERVIKSFSGSGQPTVDEFEKDVRGIWGSRGLKDEDKEEKLNIIRNHVTETVKGELMCHPSEKREDPEEVFKILQEVWGEQRTVSELLGTFYAVSQRGYEGVREFSHRLNRAFCDLTTRQEALNQQRLSEQVLRDHFVAGLGNDQLRRRLREQIHQKETTTFLEVRGEAMRWTKDEEDVPREAVAAQAEVSSRQIQAMEAIVEKLGSMEAKMKQLEEQFQSISQKPRSHDTEEEPKNRRLPYTRDGRPICLLCKEAGHIRRRCPKGLGNERPQ